MRAEDPSSAEALPANRWLAETGGTRGPEYAARFAELAGAGEDVHGEAAAVDALLPRRARVLDAGCGTGRVASELARRGHLVTGVDLDASMLEEARRADPAGRWVLGDLLEVAPEEVGAPLDAVVLAGNVVVYLTPGTEGDVLTRLAGWLVPGGLLVAGFAADRHVAPEDLAGWCAAAGLEPVDSWGGWGGEPAGGDYSVQVHRRRR
ncbi:bifunctional 2-polyprenyl-6-hydroxyphenol methylase/3-demethylubiquinol 3-O-methyltransferase UbiG [uncultured Pseudokineococcus sp.]|uniref:class I SAM-dependent methyltransferase n=1 Tax=uncultured Pseudokineococcus sp. TaxID=1642928 RepID=UPI00260EAAB3|nr:class I SAM-dependent methyltransferase [uncultured Pseudokineococcus sp.]